MSKPSSANDILRRLEDNFADLTPQLQKAARYIIDFPKEVGVNSMRSIATAAGVHPNTLVRLAKQLEFEGYEDLRERFRDFLTSGMGSFPDRARWLQQMMMQGGEQALLSQMAHATFGNVEQMYHNIDMEELKQAVDWIINGKRTYILGVGAAYSLAFDFWYVARMALDNLVPVPRNGSLPIDDLSKIGPDDILMAMTFQPYRSETLTAVRISRERGARVIGITDSRASPLVKHSDISLIVPTHTPQFFQSSVAVSALLDLMLAMIAARGGDEATRLIEEFHHQRHETGVYQMDDR